MEQLKFLMVSWDGYQGPLVEASKKAGVTVKLIPFSSIDNGGPGIAEIAREAKDSDLIILHNYGQGFWDLIYDAIPEGKKVISCGPNPMVWAKTNIDRTVAARSYDYIVKGGDYNLFLHLKFLKAYMTGSGEEVEPPEEVPWHGIIHHSDPKKVYTSLDSYWEEHPPDRSLPTVGILMFRPNWINDLGCVECALSAEVENAGANVILAYAMSDTDPAKGGVDFLKAARMYMAKDGKSVIDALIRTFPFPMGGTGRPSENSASFLREFNVPVYAPVIDSMGTVEKWRESCGLTTQVTWCIRLPELDGMIEPIMLAASREDGSDSGSRAIIKDRGRKLAERAVRHAALRRKENRDKKILFIYNNNPCEGLEGNVGSGMGLDTHQSLVNLLGRFRDAGYSFTVPSSGKELADTILEKRAISEFRWTTAEMIKERGGVFHEMTLEEYMPFFNSLSDKVKKEMIDTWGEPPGKGMVLDGKLLITGLDLGNAAVIVQPKRGCAGAACDGNVCKILHDPNCPPTHQYLATYYYYEEIWGADAIVHVGTHGNMEFLPGKTAGMSGDCYPDICVGKCPHFYIYNTVNAAEAMTAKRRGQTTICDHMQYVMRNNGLYDSFSDLDELMDQYEKVRDDPGRAEVFKKELIAKAKEAHLDELRLDDSVPVSECVTRVHEALSRLENAQTHDGLHVLGQVPEGEEVAYLAYSILKFDTSTDGIRALVAESLGADIGEVYADRGKGDNCRTIEKIEETSIALVKSIVSGKDVRDSLAGAGMECSERNISCLEAISETVKGIADSLKKTDEISAVGRALDGGYTEPGSSGAVSRGHPEILPTGRNMFSTDPKRCPTKVSFEVGRKLADSLVKRYIDEEGAVPENVAFYWMPDDITTTEGEVLAEIMCLMGVRPKWAPNGVVQGFDVIPLEELGRPRIDVTVRASGILRDNYTDCMDLIDSIVCALSEIDEDVQKNYIRKHTLEAMEDGADFREGTTRIYSSAPGGYSAGVDVAISSGAWETDADLADLYVKAGCYTYGGGRDGKEMKDQFVRSLKTVKVTSNNSMTDEYDLLSCHVFFSTHGGLTVAASVLSGSEVKSYYGDTRDPNDVHVHTLADELRRVARTKLLNPAWIEGMKKHGYKGATDIMNRSGHMYGWGATTKQVDDWIFDGMAEKFVLDAETRQFFKDNNPYALEEISRRLLEAAERDIWKPSGDILERLKESYLEIESWAEGMSDDD